MITAAVISVSASRQEIGEEERGEKKEKASCSAPETVFRHVENPFPLPGSISSFALITSSSRNNIARLSRLRHPGWQGLDPINSIFLFSSFPSFLFLPVSCFLFAWPTYLPAPAFFFRSSFDYLLAALSLASTAFHNHRSSSSPLRPLSSSPSFFLFLLLSQKKCLTFNS